MAIIGTILSVGGLIAAFILYIVSIVKAFKAGDTLWGVLNLIFGLGIIYFFLKGPKKLGMYCLFAYIAIIVGGILGGAGLAALGTGG